MTPTDRRLFDLRTIRNSIEQFMWMNDDGLHDNGLDYDEYMALLGLLRMLPEFKNRLVTLRDMGVGDDNI